MKAKKCFSTKSKPEYKNAEGTKRLVSEHWKIGIVQRRSNLPRVWRSRDLYFSISAG